MIYLLSCKYIFILKCVIFLLYYICRVGKYLKLKTNLHTITRFKFLHRHKVTSIKDDSNPSCDETNIFWVGGVVCGVIIHFPIGDCFMKQCTTNSNRASKVVILELNILMSCRSCRNYAASPKHQDYVDNPCRLHGRDEIRSLNESCSCSKIFTTTSVWWPERSKQKIKNRKMVL